MTCGPGRSLALTDVERDSEVVGRMRNELEQQQALTGAVVEHREVPPGTTWCTADTLDGLCLSIVRERGKGRIGNHCRLARQQSDIWHPDGVVSCKENNSRFSVGY